MENNICDLIVKMQDVFKLLRVLAFAGAAFILAKYAWEAITTGKIGGKDMMEGVKITGIGMLVGFFLLFGIGIVLSALLSGHIVDCAEVLKSGWN